MIIQVNKIKHIDTGLCKVYRIGSPLDTTIKSLNPFSAIGPKINPSKAAPVEKLYFVIK